MLELLQYNFMRNALAAGLLASVACGIVGSYVVVKRIVFISGGISHAAFGGIGLGYFLGLNPIIGAVIFAILSALGIGFMRRRIRREDTTIGIIWTAGMALGVIFIGLSKGYAPDLFSYLFGNILTVPFFDIIVMFFLDVVIVVTVVSLYKGLLALSFDEEYARASGIPVDVIYLILMCLVALTVVILIRVVGIILVIALLTIPAATANIFVANLKKMMLLSILLGAIFTTLGLWLSYILDTPSGATIILLSAVSFLATMIIKKFGRRKESTEQEQMP